MSERIALSQFMLGFEPYIVIQCKPDADPENEAGFLLKVSAGGGVGNRDQIACLLLLAVEEITGVSTDLYVREVDTVRRAAGESPLSDGFDQL